LTDKELRYFYYIETCTNEITLAQYINFDDETNTVFGQDVLPAVVSGFQHNVQKPHSHKTLLVTRPLQSATSIERKKGTAHLK
jgi:hypothetical protein